MSRYGNLGSYSTDLGNVQQYDQSKALDNAIAAGLKTAQSLQRNFKTKADIEAERRSAIASQAAIDKIDEGAREGLMIPSDTGAGALNDTRVALGELVVGKLNAAKKDRDNGVLTAADYSRVAINLEAQVQAYKSAEKIIYSNMASYNELNDDGTYSRANDTKASEFYSALSTGRANLEFSYDKNGKISFGGTWTDAVGDEQDVNIALEKMEQMPQPLEKPKTNAKGQRAADIDNLLDTKTSNVFSRLTSRNDSGGRSIYTSQMQSMTDNDTGEVKEWVKQATKESFDGYFDSLGRGDLRTGLKQYMLDSLDATDDGTTDQNDQQLFGYASVNDFVNSLDRDGLKAFRKELYDDYAKDMQAELLQASKDKVEELNNAELSTAAVVAKDEYNLRNYNQKTNELNNPKGGSKGAESGDELLDELQRQFNTASTPEKATGLSKAQFIGGQGFDYKKMSRPGEIDFEDIEIPTGPIGSSGEQKKIPDPDNVMIKIGSNKALKVAKDDLNTPEGFMRSYLAAKGIPTKPTKTNPKTIEWYMRRLNLTPVKNISDKYGI